MATHSPAPTLTHSPRPRGAVWLALVSVLALILASMLPLDGGANALRTAQRDDAQQLWASPLGFPPHIAEAYRAPPTPYSSGHRGIDLRPALARASLPVVAPERGIVTFVGSVVDRPVITIRLNEGTLVSLEPVTSALAVGDTVDRGAPLGTTDRGGHCDTRCVHLGVRINDDYVNPARFMLTRPVLLPAGE